MTRDIPEVYSRHTRAQRLVRLALVVAVAVLEYAEGPTLLKARTR
jgi:hypothetical protein